MIFSFRIGLLLWRAGILIVGGYFAFLALRLILRIADPVLEIGVALRNALRQHVPDREVLVFGSRATRDTREYSERAEP